MLYNSLCNKHIVIIGGTSGLGLATAKMAISAGAKVHIGGSTSENLTTALTQLGEKASGELLDISLEDSTSHFFSSLNDIDHLLITAARIAPASLLNGSLSTLQMNMDSRFWGAVYAIRAAVPRMVAEGSITLTSGMITRRPQPNKSVAAAAASALETLAHSLVAELAPRRINVINPGPMHTSLLENALGNSPDLLQQVAQNLPLKRIGQPENYAHSALFAMTNTDLNGEVLHLNGGAAWM